MGSPQLVHFILCTPVINAVNDVWFSKQNPHAACLEALRLNSDPTRWREGEAVSVMLQMLRFEYRPAYLLPRLSGKRFSWFDYVPPGNSYLDWTTTASFQIPFDSSVINHRILRLVQGRVK